MNLVRNEESLHGVPLDKMRGLVSPQKKLSINRHKVKTYSEYSIHKCDSNLCIFYQDTLPIFSSGDLGCYALSAKEYIICSCSSITFLSGSSVSEAFALFFQGESATSSSILGKEVNRARADLLMPAAPLSLSSVIFSSFWAFWDCATAVCVKGVWDHKRQGPNCPSLTPTNFASPSGHLAHVSSNGGVEFASDSQPSLAHLLHYKAELGRLFPMKASLNIPDSDDQFQVESQHMGTDPSFKIESTPLKDRMLNISATCNQYALYTTSKIQAAGKLDKYGFASFPQNIMKNRWGIPCRLGLCGGGESAANGWGSTTMQKSAVGWGSNGTNQSTSQNHWGNGPNRSSGSANEPSQASNIKQNPPSNNPQMNNTNNQPNNPVNTGKQGSANGQQAASQQQQPAQQQASNSQQPNASQGNPNSSNTWAQAAGKGLPSGNSSSDAQKLQNIKESLLSREGWGGENVNQDLPWDIPASPEPSKDAPTPHWKVVVNNGCELWENNLRNGGVAPPKPQQPPWGRGPIRDIGGMWGEEEEPSESSNVWAGPSNQPQWGNNPSNPPNMWGAHGKKPDWVPGPNWGEHGPPRPADGAGDWGPQVGSHPGPPGHSASHPASHPATHSAVYPGSHPTAPHPVNHPPSHAAQHGAHPTQHPGSHNAPHNQHPHSASHSTSHPGSHPAPHSATHPSHPSHVAPHVPPHIGSHVPHVTQHVPPHIGPQWNGAGKDKPTGWEEPSPPPGRRDDGTEYWGNPTQQQANISRWKDLPNPHLMARQGMASVQQTRLTQPPMPAGTVKPEQKMWGHGRSGSWEDAPHDTGNTVWGDAPINSPSWISKTKPSGTPGGWNDADLDFPGWPNQKKEEIAAAVHGNTNMPLEESLMDLATRGSSMSSSEPWRNIDDHPSSTYGEQSNPATAAALQSQQQHIQPPQQQRFPHMQLPINSPVGGNGNTPQVRALLQCIQIAVNHGYLNQQILHQPLAPGTLVPLNQMLSQIQKLHGFAQQLNLAQANGHNRNNAHLIRQLEININKTKQSIQGLQIQIGSHQNTYMKQQPQSQPQPPQNNPHLNPHLVSGHPSGQNDFLKGSLPEPLLNSFSQINIDPSGGINSLMQGSRLGTWKMNSPEHDDPLGMMNNDFVRAPGKPSLSQSQVSSNISSALPGTNSTWSLNPRSETDWPVSGNSNSGPGVSSSNSVIDKVGSLTSPWQNTPGGAASCGLDIKPFEPGKTWMQVNNSIEDDPNVTPGSVAKSPLVIGTKLNPIAKPSSSNSMADIGGSNDPLSISSLGSNTWSFNPSSGQPRSSSPSSGDTKLSSSTNLNKGSAWGNDLQSSSAFTSEFWGEVPGSKARGPPPGMGSSGSHQQGLCGTSVAWGTIGRSTSWSGDQPRHPSNSALHSSGSQPWPTTQSTSNWLILKNLTPQIDGSTLKALCSQHGPLVKFHLVLNHGFALVNYGSREEATKAQRNLNNTLLSNTTILAEFASNAEVNQLLSQTGPPSSTWGGSGQVSTPTSQTTSNMDSWSSGGASLWPSQSDSVGSSLWGTSSLTEGDQHRSTPSSLKSYLPEGLLTSEPM